MEAGHKRSGAGAGCGAPAVPALPCLVLVGCVEERGRAGWQAEEAQCDGQGQIQLHLSLTVKRLSGEGTGRDRRGGGR